MKLRFFIALWAAKVWVLFSKLLKNDKDDKAGLLAYKLCPKFNYYIKKPSITVAITGTNGKTTTTNLINNIFKLSGKKTVCNDWGANFVSGHARCLIDSVNIFNKSIVDAAVLETDEVTAPKSLPELNPNYLIITNICRDSIRRNANYDYIFNQLKQAVADTKNVTLILNADDPISSFISDTKKCIYYSINKNESSYQIYAANDFPVCPKCFSIPIYDYQHYRHIGKVHCPNCDFKSKQGDYIVSNLDYKNKTMTINNNKTKEKYNFDLDNIFNAFNYLSVITFFRTIGYSYDDLKLYISKTGIPISRKEKNIVNGIEIINQASKGQNVSASSTVFDYLRKEKDEFEILMIIDEVYWNKHSFETVTWLYETDFEFLNLPNLRRIVVSSKRYKDYNLRLLLAGIPKDKIVCINDDYDTVNHLILNGTKKVYVLYEIESITKSKKIKDMIIERIKEEGAKYED